MVATDTDGIGAAPSLTLMDRFREAAARLAASPRTQSWVARFAPTRPIAQHQALALFDLCAGFVYSQVLQAFVQAELHERLQNGPKSPAELALATGLPANSMERLLKAATALGLAGRRSGGRYGLALRGAALAGNPGVVAMIRHHALLYADLEDPLALLRNGGGNTRTHRFWSYLAADRQEALTADSAARYSALMAASQTMIADAVATAFPFRDYASILDVGGGTGRFLERVAPQAPHARLALFDLPPVAAEAATRLARAGLEPRISTHGGDFTAAPLPAGHDLITLVRVVYDHEDEKVLALLKACRAALGPEGALLVAEPMAGQGSDARIADSYFNFYLLAMGSGRTRSPEEHAALLRRAGFTRIREARSDMPVLTRMVLAKP